MAEIDDEGRISDHAFQPEQKCTECGEYEIDCECNDPMMEDEEDGNCAECGESIDDPSHVEEE